MMSEYIRYSVYDLPSITEQMLHFIPDPILEEEIFTPYNMDPDCSTIGRLLYEYGERFILSARLWRIASTQSRYGTTSGC